MKKNEETNKGLNEERTDLAGSSNNDHQNASATRGGTTDMDHHSTTGATGGSNRGNHGSGMGTKREVTGSDYDGQVTDR
jgi:hypothetical protein